MTLLEITTRQFFADLEASGARYALLRNAEHLFDLRKENSDSISDIDLVVDSGDLNLLRYVMTKVAVENGWDAAIECDHWARSPVRNHNIEVFRLYAKDPLVCFQVDVFHAFLTHGVPLLDERQLLDGRKRDPARGVMRIDSHHENMIRLIQIAGLADAPRKRERYRRRLISHARDHGFAFLGTLSSFLGGFAARAVTAIQEDDLHRAKRWTDLGRAWFFARFALRNPVRTGRLLVHRVTDQTSRFYTNQCGCVGRFHAPNEEARSTIRSVLDEMTAGNLINHWMERPSSWLGIRERLAMEQSSLLLRWAGPGDCDVDFRACVSRGEVASLLVDFLAFRHQRLPTSRAATGVMGYA
jgi:hypothetical protein